MLALMIILVAAAIGQGLAAWRRLPAIPVLVGMGILLDAAGVAGEIQERKDALRLGLTVVLFMVGTQLDPAIVQGWRRTAAIFGLAQFTLLGATGFGLGILLGFDQRAALYVGLAIAASSTIVVTGVLRSREQVFEPLGRVAIGVVLLQDLLVFLLLPAVGATDLAEAARGTAATLALVLLALAVSRFVMPRLVAPLEDDGESLLLVTLAMLFAFAGLADAIGLRPEVGAFIGGLTLARFPVNGVVRGPAGSLSAFFPAIFCVSLGTLVGIDDLPDIILPTLAIAGIVLVTPLLLIPLGRALGLTTRSSIELTGLMAQCGELAVTVMLLGWLSGQLPTPLFREVALVAVATMLLAPALASDRAVHAILRFGWRRPLPADLPSAEGTVLFVGAGPSARALMRRIRRRGGSVLAIDDDPATTAMLRAEGIPVVHGEGADPHLLHRIGVRRAATIVSTVRRRRDHERLTRLAGRVPVLLRTFDPELAAALGGDGVKAISEADAGAEAFLAWYDAWAAERAATDPAARRG